MRPARAHRHLVAPGERVKRLGSASEGGCQEKQTARDERVSGANQITGTRIKHWGESLMGANESRGMARDGAKKRPAASCVACNGGMQRTKVAAAAREAVGKLRRRSVAPSRWRPRPHLAAKPVTKAHTT